MDPELEKLEDLYSAGFIFEEEYNRRRTEICERLGISDTKPSSNGRTNTYNPSDWNTGSVAATPDVGAFDTSGASTQIEYAPKSSNYYDTSYSSPPSSYDAPVVFNPYSAPTETPDYSYDPSSLRIRDSYDNVNSGGFNYADASDIPPAPELPSYAPVAPPLPYPAAGWALANDSDIPPAPKLPVVGPPAPVLPFNLSGARRPPPAVSRPAPVPSFPKKQRELPPAEPVDTTNYDSHMDLSQVVTTPLRSQNYDEIHDFDIESRRGIILSFRDKSGYFRSPICQAGSITVQDAAEMFAMTHCELKIWEEGEWRTKYSTVSGPNEKIVSGLYHVHRVYSRLHFAKRRVEVVESRKLITHFKNDVRSGVHIDLPLCAIYELPFAYGRHGVHILVDSCDTGSRYKLLVAPGRGNTSNPRPLSDCLSSHQFSAYRLIDVRSMQVYESSEKVPLPRGFYMMQKTGKIVPRTRQSLQHFDSEATSSHRYTGLSVIRWVNPTSGSILWYSGDYSSSTGPIDKSALQSFVKKRPKIQWTMFLVGLQHALHRKPEFQVMSIELKAETLIPFLEKAISNGRCIITGDDAVPGSFLSAKYHHDALIKSFQESKKFSTEAEPDLGGDSVESPDWGLPQDDDPRSKYFASMPTLEQEMQDAREEWAKKEKIAYINLRSGSPASFRKHTVTNRISRALDFLYNPYGEPPFDDAADPLEAKFGQPLPYKETLRQSSENNPLKYSRDKLRSSRDRFAKPN